MKVFIIIAKCNNDIIEVYSSAQKAIESIIGKTDTYEVVVKDLIEDVIEDTQFKSITEVNERVYEPLHFNSVLRFGKHRGKTLGDILQSEPDYLVWCKNNINLCMDEECEDLLKAALEK